MADKERREQIALTVKGLNKAGELWAHNLRLGNCPFCGKPVNDDEFDDDISRAEFELSHLCQSCQNITFGKE